MTMAGPPLAAFTRGERRLVARLTNPERVQRWLSSLPYNLERRGETARSFREVVRHGTAHCFEAAMSAATVLEQHGYAPLLLDLESSDELDHVLFLFRRGGRWGAIGRSREPGLEGRKAAFASVRRLVGSYLDPYVDGSGRVTAYGVLDLRELPRRDWRLASRNLRYVENALREMPHTRIAMGERRYRRVLATYRAFKARHPRSEPVAIYSGRDAWMA
jgi:hypothetical protein